MITYVKLNCSDGRAPRGPTKICIANDDLNVVVIRSSSKRWFLKELLSFSACLALAWHMPIPIACYLEAKPKLLNIFHVFADDVHVHDAWLKTGSV